MFNFLKNKHMVNNLTAGQDSGIMKIELRKVRKFFSEEQSFYVGGLLIIDENADRHIINYGDMETCELRDYGVFSVQLGDWQDDGTVVTAIVENRELLIHFMLTQDQLTQLQDYYRRVNEKIERKQNEFNTSLNAIVKDLISNEEIYKICYNFVRKSDHNVFFGKTQVIAVEMLIKHSTRIGIKSLQFNDPMAFDDNIDAVLETMKNFYSEMISLLKILITRYDFKLDDDNSDKVREIVFIVWRLLREVAIVYYHDEFERKYGNWFENVDTDMISEYALKYVSKDDLDCESQQNISLFTCYLMRKGKYKETDFFYNRENLEYYISEYLEAIKLQQLEDRLLEKQTLPYSCSIDDVDLMNGHEFEKFVAQLFSKMGYSTQVTKGSGDQGVDVIAERNGRKFGIQAKCYANAITNKAVQEVTAGIIHYKLDKAIVVTNNYFTDSAKELAQSNGVVLWDRNMLKEKINDYL